jgi:hypothetical protein
VPPRRSANILRDSNARGRLRDDEIFTSAAVYAARAGAFRLSRGGGEPVGYGQNRPTVFRKGEGSCVF